MRYFRQVLAVLVSTCVVGAQTNFPQTSADPPQPVEQSSEKLQQLVAPIALYPDALVAQILPASTYPEQIVEAAKWMEDHKELKGAELAQEVDGQTWDSSVKALTQFPAVLANMKQNLAWTSELGDAYLNQQKDVSQAIQTMRERAKQAGNLKTTPQETVKTKHQKIAIEPVETDLVYVPVYDPWLVYGPPVAVFPGWYPYSGLFLEGPGIDFGLGFGIGLFAGFGWGWHHWGYDWRHDGRVEWNHNSYYSHSTTIVNHNGFRSGGWNGGRGLNSGGGRNSLGSENGRGEVSSREGRQGFQGSSLSHEPSGMHSGAFGGVTRGGIASGNASRGEASFGGFRGGGFGGGFPGGGGFHGGGGGGHGGGGHR